MNRQRVVMLLSNDFSSDPRVEKEALALIAAGWDVTVVAWCRTGRFPEEENQAGVDIVRVGPVAPYGSGPRSLPLFRQFWRNAADVAVKLAPRVVHCHDMDTAWAGVSAVKRLGRDTKLVLDFHEMYRESRMVPKGRITGPLGRMAIDIVERRALKRTDLLVLAVPGFEERYGAFAPRVIVENAPDHTRFVPRPDVARDGLRVCYIGQKRYVNSLRDLMEAVQRDERLSAFIAGGGVAEQKVDEMARDYDRVEISGHFTYAETPSLYEGCSAVYAVYDQHVGNIRLAMPVKALEGMAAGLPVITNRDTWFGRFVVAEKAGLVVEGGDVDELTTALLALVDDPEEAAAMGARGRAIVEERLNWTSASGRLVEAYEKFR